MLGSVWRLGMFCGALLFVFAAAIGSARKSAITSATAELPSGPIQAKATTACTECHEARIIVQQRLSKAVWTKEVDKMTKWGALVDPADRESLIDYLSTNFGPDRPPYLAPRTARETRGTAGSPNPGS